jgi:hypothetical protein
MKIDGDGDWEAINLHSIETFLKFSNYGRNFHTWKQTFKTQFAIQKM